tara:strand:+ start:6578 stop:6760 length:183 start_codon:yes stop_codon:yes gene_type:complete
MNYKKPSVFKSIQAQEKWRQKQIDIYYGKGRPLFPNWKERVEYPIIPNEIILRNIHRFIR